VTGGSLGAAAVDGYGDSRDRSPKRSAVAAPAGSSPSAPRTAVAGQAPRRKTPQIADYR
jgi:hypothetical protein